MNDAASEATEARRRTILASSLTAAQVAAQLNGANEGAATDIDDLRRAGEIFGVWHKEAAAFVYPRFQFEPQVSAASRRHLLSLLASLVGFVPTDDPGGWRRAFWLYQRNSRLSPRCCAYDRNPIADPIAAVQYLIPFSADARTPAEAFAEEPNSVFALVNQIGAA